MGGWCKNGLIERQNQEGHRGLTKAARMPGLTIAVIHQSDYRTTLLPEKIASESRAAIVGFR